MTFGISVEGFLAEADVFELDGGAFGFEAEEAGGDVAPAGDFLAIHPEAYFATDGPDEVVGSIR
ncbi:MAG: hypothetical protein ACJAXZ_003935 [Akkermansiaceae bacterium]